MSDNKVFGLHVSRILEGGERLHHFYGPEVERPDLDFCYPLSAWGMIAEGVEVPTDAAKHHDGMLSWLD